MAKAKRKKSGVPWGVLMRGGSRLAAVLALIGAGLGLTLGVEKVRARATDVLASPEGGEPAALAVTFDWPALPDGGTWLPEGDQAALVSAVRYAAGDPRPLDSVPLKRISKAIGETGWFASDPRVRVSGPGSVHVSGEWRRPAAVVRWGAGETERDYLISDDGHRMPPEWRPGGSNQPVIVGCSRPPPSETGLLGRYGAPWEGQDIQAGLHLLGVLATAGLRAEITGVDVGRHRSGGPLEIISRQGSRVVWGSAPDEWAEGEPSVAERVNRLRGLLSRTGRIDGGERRIEIHREHVEIDRTGDD